MSFQYLNSEKKYAACIDSNIFCHFHSNFEAYSSYSEESFVINNRNNDGELTSSLVCLFHIFLTYSYAFMKIMLSK